MLHQHKPVTPLQQRMWLWANGANFVPLQQQCHLFKMTTYINAYWEAQTNGNIKKPSQDHSVDAVKHHNHISSCASTYILQSIGFAHKMTLFIYSFMNNQLQKIQFQSHVPYFHIPKFIILHTSIFIHCFMETVIFVVMPQNVLNLSKFPRRSLIIDNYLGYLDYWPPLYCYTLNVSANLSFSLLQVFHVELRSPHRILSWTLYLNHSYRLFNFS